MLQRLFVFAPPLFFCPTATENMELAATGHMTLLVWGPSRGHTEASR